MGDDMAWAGRSFDDAGWDTKQLGARLVVTGLKENVYAWFRIKIVIPTSMKSQAQHGKGIKIELGKIDDVDQTFFNGRLIGQTGSLPPDYETRWDTQRVYFVPDSEVKWDKENVIAVRLFSPDIGGVGMYEGPYSYGAIQWSDFISVQHTISETDKNGFVTKITFTNKGNDSFDGAIKYRIADKNNRELFTETKQVSIQPAQGFEQEVAFSNYQPTNGNIFRVGYRISENNGTASVSDEQLYLADRHINIPIGAEPKPIVQNKVKDEFTSIPFQNQQQRGYLGVRMNQNLAERLLKLDEEGTLDGYLARPGHHPWAGEHIGKYLETATNVWKNTGNEKLKSQMDRMMYQLVNAQLPDGYLGTYSPDEYWTGWDVWSHKYNLYGLLAYYNATGYRPALEASKKMGDLLCKTFGNKPGQRDIILAGEHVGMAATSVLDPMVELYKATGDKKYLDFCYYILGAWEQDNGPKIVSSLLATGKVTKVGNGKAYEMLSNVVGLVKLYRVTGDKKLLQPVLIAWEDIVSKRLYITGTTSSHEHFQDDDMLPAGKKDNMGEGCVTVTWIQLNQQLLAVTGESKYAEQIEKSIYNHLLAAENPRTGCVSYYTSLMDQKPFTCNISCCQSSVPRGIAMIPYFTFGNIKNVPTLMMYEPATYKENIATADKRNINLSLQVESRFPENGDADVTVTTSRSARFPIALRVPSWTDSFTATVGGKVYQGISNQNLIIDRSWKSGEKIKVSFQMPVQILTGGKSYPGQIAFQRGPQVLAFDSSLNTDVLKTYPLGFDQKLLIEEPVAKNNAGLLRPEWIGQQAYTANIIDKKNPATKKQLVLVPFADASQTAGEIKVWLPLILESIDQKVEKIFSQLTLEEKVSLIHGNTYFTTAGVPRLGIPGLHLSDGPSGVREEMSPNSWDSANWTNDSSAYFPALTSLAATWNTELAAEFGIAYGEEAVIRGKNIMLAPGMNIIRTPLNGRNWEYLSEDPFLTGHMVLNFIKTAQSKGIAVCAKHFALNNQCLNQGAVDVEASERALREIYLPAFETAVKEGKVLSVMGAYNKFRGTYAAQNSYLIQDILKGEWGFRGFVMSDWGATHNTMEAAKNGLDLEMMPVQIEGRVNAYYMGQPLLDSIKAGMKGSSKPGQKSLFLLLV